jgi:hypothetical protein
MDKLTVTALKGSIEKWRGIAAGTKLDHGISNCPLCTRFHHLECSGCPVMNATGRFYCKGTPYSAYRKAERTYSVDYEQRVRRAALAELKFLKSLLPKGGA